MTSEYRALPQRFLEAVDRYGNPRAQINRGSTDWQAPGDWVAVSASEMLRRVAGLSQALAEMGVRPGDRVSIFSPNCPEWHVADFAIQGLGAIVVPVYFHESTERLTYILKDSGAAIVFTAGEEQARRLDECRRDLPGIENVISATPARGIGHPGPLPKHLGYEDLVAQAGQAEIALYRRRALDVTPQQLATIIYTSGTTGEPKGVMLTHANLSSNAQDFGEDFGMNSSDVALSLLPLAHIYERTIDYSHIFRGVSLAYVRQMETVAQALLEVRPTTMAAVPRFYEKTYANIIDRGHRQTGWKRKIFDAAMRVAAEAVPWKAHGKPVSASVKLRWRLADRAVFSKIRAGLGGRIRTLSSGGGPLAQELAEFFWSVGLPVYQGYGLTETSPVVTFNSPKANQTGTVGRPIAHVELRLADDGEILVKGPCVMLGYYKKPEQTREAFTADGWFLTGDIGRLNEDGFLIITDRKKELLKTSGGKFVAPAPIENLLKTSPLVTNAMVVGDGRKFVSVLVVCNFAGIEQEAHKAGKQSPSPAQMLGDPWVRELMASEIERLTMSFAQYERPKRFALLEQDFTFARGELTFTFKLKRRVITEHYQETIARLYADVEEPRPLRRG
jgi:long-chain acyl-CoA synthetase